MSPRPWPTFNVGEVFRVVGGGTPSTHTAEYWEGKVPWITSADLGDGTIVPRRFISERAVAESAAHVVPAGSLIVATRVGLGKIGLAEQPTAFSQDCHGLVVDADRVESRFALLQLAPLVRQFRTMSRGTTIAGVTKKQLMDLRFVLPPLEEQRRVAGIIDAHFSRLRAAAVQLGRAARNSEVFRREVLELLLAAQPANSEPLSSAAEAIVDCPHSTPKFVGSGRPCVDSTNVLKGSVVGDKIRFVDESTFAERTRRYAPEPGDVVFVREGSVGRTAVLPLDLFPCLGQRVVVIRPGARLVGRYLSLALESRVARRQFLPKVLGTTSPHLNVREIATIAIPVPPLEEQNRIVFEAERHLSVLDHLNQEIETTLSRATTLKDAIIPTSYSPDAT